MRITTKQFQTCWRFWAMGLIGLIPILAFTSTSSVAVKDLSVCFLNSPVAVDDSIALDENALIVFNPTLNDSVNGRLVGLSIVSAPKHGTIGFSAIDTLIYKPNPSFCGKDTVWYAIANETYTFDTAMIVVTVRCGEILFNQAPDALDDVFSAYKNTRIDLSVLDNDSLKGDFITPLSIVQFPTYGEVLVSTNAISYLPQNDFCAGYDTLRYAVCNVYGCDTATVIIYIHCTVDNTNAHQPIAVDDRFSMERNAFHVFRPTLNDTVKGTLSGVSIVKGSNNGSVGFVGIDTLVYMPQIGYCGSDTISYRVCNTLFLCDTATIFIDIDCTKEDSTRLTQLPDAVDDETTTLEAQTVTISVLTNDNPNGIMIAPLSIVRYPSKGSASIAINDVTYTPLNGFCNGLDTFTYQICNGLGCDTAQVIITVNCEIHTRVNDPIAKEDNIVTDRNKTIKFNPTINDTLNGTLLTVAFVSPPRHGAIGSTSVDTLVYSPVLNYCGKDTLEYRVCRTDFKCDTAFIFITVNCTPLGERPDAMNDMATTLKNKTVNINVLSNDALNGGLSTPLSIVSQPTHGTVGIDVSNYINYTPLTGFCGGKDSFSYKICNIDGCDTATVVVDVLCENPNRPDARDDAALIIKGKVVDINVLANDVLNGILDSIKILKAPKNAVAFIQNNNITYATNFEFCGGFDTLTYMICTLGGCDTAQLVVLVLCDTTKNLTPVAQNDISETLQGRSISMTIVQNDSLFFEPLENILILKLPSHGTALLDSFNILTYTPTLSFCDGQDTLTYAICTRYGCDTASVIITVRCDTDMSTPPVAATDIAYTLRNVGIMIPILANDSLKGADKVRLIRFAKRGTASFNVSTNQVFYQPDATFCGSFDSLVYEVCNFKGCDTALVVIAVGCDTAFQILPTANFDTARVEINKTVLINILKNDSLRGYFLREVSVQPKQGLVTFRSDNDIYYVPRNEFWGRDSFVYILCNLAGCDTATVYITVHGGNNLVVYNGFSPNGDNINDRFIIRGIENYPNNEMMVYNRWGNEIFKRKGYSNDEAWAGDWQGQIILDGTYFYVIYLNDEKKQVKSGYIQVHR